ncbi:MAG: phosphatase PAP2 family protein [Propionibacteriaceae bacterium]
MVLRETIATARRPGTWGWRADLSNGLAVGFGLVVLGLVAKLPGPTATDLLLDQHMAAGRSGGLTSLAVWATTLAQPVVGLGVAVFLPLVLVLLRRRVIAVRVFGLFGGALGLAWVVKLVVGEPRPPAVLAAVAADTGRSFPSGHVTVAATMCVVVWVLTRHVGAVPRIILVGLGAAFALVVAWSRVYLGVHYLPDVIGSYLAVVAAVFLLRAFLGFPVVRSFMDRHA